jgi:hypothetical protein
MINVVFMTTRKSSNVPFDYHVARFVWRVFTMAFGLQPPTGIEDLSRVWFQQTG